MQLLNAMSDAMSFGAIGATWADCWISGKKGWGGRRLMAVALAMSGCYSIAFIA